MQASVSPPATQTPRVQPPLRLEMELILRFLEKLISFFRKRWDQSIRRLWYIFASVRSRISSKCPKERDQVHRSVEHRTAKPPTVVSCASQFPPPITPTASDDIPIASPTLISTQVRQPTIQTPPDTVHETREYHYNERLGVDGYFLEESRPISRSPNPASHQHEPEPIYIIPSPHREDHASNSVILSRPPSPSYMNNPEAAARGYLNAPPSSTCSTPRPTIEARRSTTPASVRQSAHNAPPVLLQPESQTSVSTHGDRHSVAVSFGPALPTPEAGDRLRPMIGIDRYEKQKMVVIENVINPHIFLPVTTKFVR